MNNERKPPRWALDKSLVEEDWGWFWSAATGVFPIWLAHGLTNPPTVFDLVQKTFTTGSNTLVGGFGSLGQHIKSVATGDPIIFTGVEQTYFPSADKATILYVRRKTDVTNRASASIGLTENTQRINVHGPWSDGNIYWDFGGNSGTIKRATWSSYTTTSELEVWAFTAGPTGLHIYYNGIKRASNDGTAAARTLGNSPFRINGGAASSDLQEMYFVAILDTEATPGQVAQWSRAPFGPITIAEESAFLVPGVTIVELAATIAAAGSLTTTLSVTRSLNSIIAATGSLTSALQLINGLYAALASTGAITANLDNQSGLYSAIAGLSSVFGGASVARDIAAVISAVSSYQASLDSQSGLYSDIAATSTINAKINSLKDLDSLIASVSTVSGKIGCIVNIDGTILSTSTVVGAVSLIRSLDSLLPATSTVAGELSRMISLAVVIPGVSTIVAELLIIIGEKRGFISLDNVEQHHISHSNVSQYHISKSDVSQYHVGVANEFT